MMKKIIQDQYRSKFGHNAEIHNFKRPKEGWIRTLRKALGMSSPQLASRLGISKSQASQMERMEMEDRITIKQLRRVADNLGCELFYGFVPKKPIEEMIQNRAVFKATKIVKKTDIQMTLESQKLPSQKLQQQIKYETDKIINQMPRDLWED